jgi:hypothetical protein
MTFALFFHSKELFDEHREKTKRKHVQSDVLVYDRKCLKIKSVPVPVPFENKCKKLKFDDDETALTFLNYYPLANDHRQD